jgi:hypothetical protein
MNTLSFKLSYIVLPILSAALMLQSCGSGGDESASSAPVTVTSVSVPTFNADTAFAFVKAQVAFGPRVPGTPAHGYCADYLEATLRRFTENVYRQPFAARAWNDKVLNGVNIIGSFNPEARKRVLLCAHWDSRPYADHDPDPANHNRPIDGANDGASSVGVLLEIARVLHENPIDIGVDIIFFDIEDYGEPQGTFSGKRDTWALGSQHWAKSPHIPGYHANFGILLDMVGAANATFSQEGYSMTYAPDFVRRVWRNAHQIGYGNFFLMQESNPIIDDHYYINTIARIPTINIIHQDPSTDHGFFPYWHTIEDTLDKIDPVTLKAVGQTVLHTLWYF